VLKIYTRTGDAGQTSLYDSTRVSKDDIRVESYGTIDELNATLGVSKRFLKDPESVDVIERIQRELFLVAGELATVDGAGFPDRIAQGHIDFLEKTIDTYVDLLGRDQPFRFVLPGSDDASAHLHVSRTVCRRAERRIITLSRDAEISPMLMKYVNRLADLIYALARHCEANPTYIEFNA